MNTKVCSGCKELKSRDEYSIRSDGRNLRSRCKACEAEIQREFRKTNQAQWKQIKHRYATKYPDRVADGNKRRAQKWYALHREEAIARAAQWHRENPDAVKSINDKWNKLNPDNRRAISHRRRARIRGAGGSFTAAEWSALKHRYGHVCLKCGKHEGVVKLTPDHVIPISKGGSNSIDNIQPLCRSCNSSKNDKTEDYRHAILSNPRR